MNSVEHQLLDSLHEIMGLDPAEQPHYPSPYRFTVNNDTVTIELVDVVKMYIPEDAPGELLDMLGYDETSVPPENYRVMLSTEIDMPSQLTNLEMAYCELLKLNYFGLGMGGCTFALNPEDCKKIQMHYLVPMKMADMTTQALGLFINGFLSKKTLCMDAFAKDLLQKSQGGESSLNAIRKFI